MSGGRPRYQLEPGQTFGRWTVLASFQRNTKTWATCRCQCGTIRDIPARRLMIGRSTSCGCRVARLDGRSKLKEYGTWLTRMKTGVLCPEWRDARVYLDYVQALPGFGVPNARLSRIKLRFPFRPGNVEWRVKGKPAVMVCGTENSTK